LNFYKDQFNKARRLQKRQPPGKKGFRK